MTPRPTPSLVAFLDQAKAADVEAGEIFYNTVADKDGTLTFHLPAGAERALQQGWARLGRALTAGEFTCRHLSPGAPEVALWVVGTDPARLNCSKCAIVEGLRIRGTGDDFRCDHCGTVDHTTSRTYRVLVPATVEVAYGGRGGGYSPPILATR